MKKAIAGIFISLFAVATAPVIAGEKSADKEVDFKYAKVMTKKRVKKTGSKTSPPSQEELQAASSSDDTVPKCQFVIHDFVDLRKNKETIGATLSAALQPQGIDQWLADAKADLWDRKYRSPNEGLVIDVNPKLTKLYSYGQGLNLHSVIALTVDFSVNGELVESRKYRGFGSKANMVNAVSEYYQVASYSAHDAFPKALKDFPEICHNRN